MLFNVRVVTESCRSQERSKTLENERKSQKDRESSGRVLASETFTACRAVEKD